MKEKNYEKIVIRLYNNNFHKINDWERGFISDLYNKNYNDFELSPGQKETILKINAKCLGRPYV